MMAKVLLVLYVLVALVQLSVPLGQIVLREAILRTGAAYKFRTAPVDPYDAFRGRYVALNYADTVAAQRSGERLVYGHPAYVQLEKDEEGFARFGELSRQPPDRGDYLRVTFYGTANGVEAGKARFRLPFDRFYMEESKAPRAEAAYFKHNRRGQQPEAPTFVLVRVKEGRGVIEDLYINDRPISAYLSGQAAGEGAAEDGR